MINPYLSLGLRRDASDAEIRKRYLELIRKHRPEREPERFQRIVDAYECTKTRRDRVETVLFGAARYVSFDAVLAELEDAAEMASGVPGLRELIDAENR